MEVRPVIKIGSIDLDLSNSLNSEASQNSVGGILKKSHSLVQPVHHDDPFSVNFSEFSRGQFDSDDAESSKSKGSGLHISNFKSGLNSASMTEVVKRASHLGGCSWCLSLNHRRFNCISAVRCVAYFKYGHKYKFCITRRRPNIFWRPKVVHQSEQVKSIEEAGLETEGAEAHNISSPIRSFVIENPTPASESLSFRFDSSVPPSSPEDDHMTNFAVDPTPFVPDGLEVEDWARPARERIIISGNPP